MGFGRILVVGAGVAALGFGALVVSKMGDDEATQPAARTEVSAPAASAAPRFTRAATDPALVAELQAIERRIGGRLGVMLVDPASQIVAAQRDTERFPICSTFKLPLAVMILSDVDAGSLTLDRRLPFGERRIVPNSPTIEARAGAGNTDISVEQALNAALVQSDNTAANLLLTLVGDNSGYSRRIEAAFGNDSIRMGRSEGVLNEDAARIEDTATPDAMVAVLARVYHGQTLTDASRTRLRDWMQSSRTGAARVRAGLGEGMVAGDKTGTCTRTYNSVGWIDAGGAGRPWLYAAYLDETDVSEAEAEAALADVGRLFARAIAAARQNSGAPSPAAVAN